MSLLGVVPTRSCWNEKNVKLAAESIVGPELTAIRIRFGAVKDSSVTNQRPERRS